MKYRGKGTFSFTVQPYGQEVHFCYLLDDNEMDRYAQKHLNVSWGEPGDTIFGTRHYYHGGYIGASVVWARKELIFGEPSDHGIIAHEVQHIVSNICRDCNMPRDTDNDEPFAYLSGWITEKIYFWLLTKNA